MSDYFAAGGRPIGEGSWVSRELHATALKPRRLLLIAAPIAAFAVALGVGVATSSQTPAVGVATSSQMPTRIRLAPGLPAPRPAVVGVASVPAIPGLKIQVKSHPRRNPSAGAPAAPVRQHNVVSSPSRPVVSASVPTSARPVLSTSTGNTGATGTLRPTGVTDTRRSSSATGGNPSAGNGSAGRGAGTVSPDPAGRGTGIVSGGSAGRGTGTVGPDSAGSGTGIVSGGG